ncbi:hypothetical protein [Roseobacter sp. OBYS 0001]|uniref:hypothetical protein n=1 Tax=Roseobacter sp. OBYS 0001 TaxID=882651 RepID=UPI001BBD858B|nr:hypothetical protein [Roseobacter sp. OBYS 0001]GIT86266.1 hypothetical protein ROBYS_12820 [Roseobacter sp. OBYS 0001]
MHANVKDTQTTTPQKTTRQPFKSGDVDRRPAPPVKTALQQRANTSPLVSRLATLQALANNSTGLSAARSAPNGQQVAQRQMSSQPVLQRDRVSTRLGEQTVSADQSGAAETLAFLEPGRSHGGKYAPVHLTKKIKMAGAGLIDAGGLTHGALNAQNADTPDYHFTITSGFMAAALVNSPIKNYLVKHGRAGAIWAFGGVNTEVLSQNKLKANEIVNAFNSDLDLAAGANFDNLMLTYDPDGEGPTFDAVVRFHEEVKNTLFAIPSVNPGGDLPFASVKFSQMRTHITAGADQLAAQWSNWTNNGAAATRNDFRISAGKWTDLAKAVNILNRIRAKALKLESPDAAAGAVFDDAFIDANLDAHAHARTAIKDNMNTDQDSHAEEFT